ncbi:flagellar biosynthesis anti-sigma factor FlgM [uncultured Shewanella sp.]|uniref:flagellar biosynthesis anti-sigma factor FlgM n=1 Tax=uncultured Shewanella sp. TaxID=173975 RepID=UPI002603F318|nr:flagellar biosynthesis anti-sigma factor FlgM [uncultured Shewanella sp.]
MEINKINSTINAEMGTSKSKTHSAVQPLEPPVSAGIKPRQEVSADCRLIERTQQRLDQLPDFDLAKVAEVRQSLIDGSFDLDLEKLTDAMVLQHG